jgi:thiamine biosynthesis lipoprotein
MGAVLQISVWDADTVRAVAAMTAARAAVMRVDGWMSTSQPASEVSAANRRAGSGAATPLSPWTAEVLDSALSLAAATGGALQAATGPMRFDRATRRVWLPRREMRLDLGTFARGFALDRAIEALRAAGVHGAVVDLDGTFAMLGAAPVGPRWSVALKNPFEPGEVYAAVQMDAGAVGTTTAGDTEIIDPRTKLPVRGLASVSVLAPSAMLADALSRAFFVMGPAEGCRLAARYRGVDAVWVRAPGEDEHEDRDADDGVDPELVVITDGLADRLELLSEEPTDERATRCSALLAQPQR